MKIIYKILDEIKPVLTAHGTGQKQVFLSNEQTPTKLTQFAYGSLSVNEGCRMHKHATMDEYFFFINGTGEYRIEKEIVNLKENMFLRIPAGTVHSLKNTGKSKLEFVYFGVVCE